MMTNIPRMRTIPKAIEELKKLDPDTALTVTALRRMVKTGKIRTYDVCSKKLINFDDLLEQLSHWNTETA
ncbi:MAG: hypothetical protein IJ192_11240 [Clostridia bacterium]|nr:hypothetical protein [Clostridia bacterium]